MNNNNSNFQSMINDNNNTNYQSMINDNNNNTNFHSMINNNYGGWENNEGAQGSWLFGPSEKIILFDFNYNTEEEQSVNLDYEIRF